MENLNNEYSKIALNYTTQYYRNSSVDTNKVLNTISKKYSDDEIEELSVTGGLYIGSLVFAGLVSLTGLICLILNAMKKNVGKAVFGGIAWVIIPSILIFVNSIVIGVFAADANAEFGNIFYIASMVVSLILVIINIVLSCSKKKPEPSIYDMYKTNNSNVNKNNQDLNGSL